jgi:hypothetical protein
MANMGDMPYVGHRPYVAPAPSHAGAPLTGGTGKRGVPQGWSRCYQRRSIDCCSAWRAVSRDWVAVGSGLGRGFGLSFMVLTFVR